MLIWDARRQVSGFLTENVLFDSNRGQQSSEQLKSRDRESLFIGFTKSFGLGSLKLG